MGRYEKLWKILEIALADLRACERDKKFVIDMNRYYVKREGKCHVCLAGACLVQSGKVQHYRNNGPTAWMVALDYLRSGLVSYAYYELHGRCLEGNLNRSTASYHADKKGWWKDMEKLVVDLREQNI